VKRLLFVTATYIGDQVLTSGLLAAWAARHPEGRVTVAGGAAGLSLFAAAPGVERLIPIVKRGRIGHWLDLWRETAGSAWHSVIDVRGSALAYLLWAGRRRVFRPDASAAHRTECLARLVDLPALPRPLLWTAPEDQAEADTLVVTDRPLLVLGPTGNWQAKIWPAERFAELARRLIAPGAKLAGARIVVLGAKGEEAMVAPLLTALPEALDLVGRARLAVAAAILKRAGLFVGNDSGLLYMAVASGRPTLGLFGPTPGLFGPKSEGLLAPWAPNAAEARTPESWLTLTSASAIERGAMPSRMGTLTVDAVERAALHLLERMSR